MNTGTYAKLTARLDAVARHILLVQIAGAVLYTLAAGAVFSLVLAIFESFAYASPAVKAVLFHLLWAVPFFVFLGLILLYVMRKPGHDETARLIERAFPALNDRLISAVQLGRTSTRHAGQSPELVDALIEYANDTTSILDLRRAIPRGQLIASFHAAAAGVILVLGFTVAFPDRIVPGLYRIVDHTRVYQPLDMTTIYATHRTPRIIKGEDFTVYGFVSGADIRDVLIWYRWGTEKNWNMKPVAGSRRAGDFEATVENPRASFEYYLEAPGASTPIFAVEVIERPAIVSLETTLSYPDYTGLGTVRRTDGDGNIRALAGTGAAVSVRANKPLSAISLVWGDSTATPCSVQGDSGFVEFEIAKSIDYHFELVDTLGIAGQHPVMYRITCLNDENPSITLLSPAADVILPGSMELPLVYRTGDDFGISALELQFQVPYEKQKRIVPLPKPAEKSITAEYVWNLSGLNLLPEDTVPYSLVVYDTDRVNGPKRAESETRMIRMPSVTDIYAETRDSQDSDIQKLLDISKRAEEQQQKIEDVNKALKSGEQMDWSNKNVLDEMQKNIEQMQQDFKDVAGNIESLAERLSSEDIAAVETLSKLEQISTLMNQIAEGDMKNALKQLTQVSTETNPERMKQYLDQHQVTTEEIQSKLDRIISLLKQAKTIQQFEMARNILEDLALKQTLLEQKYKAAPEDSSLVREENILSQEMEKTRNP